MNDEDLRDLFAAFAMVSKMWTYPSLKEHAANCYAVADAMIDAKYANNELEVGIATVKKRVKKPEN